MAGTFRTTQLARLPHVMLVAEAPPVEADPVRAFVDAIGGDGIADADAVVMAVRGRADGG